MSPLLAIAHLFTSLAIAAQPIKPPAAFVLDVTSTCVPVVQPGEFVGCIAGLNNDDGSLAAVEDDAPFAGIKWVDGTPRWVTGP